MSLQETRTPVNADEKRLLDYEDVFTVTQYWDGPRQGIANFNDKPHFYKCVFDESKDEWSDTFVLSAVDEKTYQLALEDWRIWKRWEDDFQKGKVKLDSHPALVTRSTNQAEISNLLVSGSATDPRRDLTARGIFQPVSPQRLGPNTLWKVKWIPQNEGK